MNAGLCLSDPHPDQVNDGASNRTLAAARFAGRYRLVDFMLSNMVNSGINSIGIILNSQYQSLVTHIGMGKEWDLARKSGGVTLFPPYMSDERRSVNNELDGPLQRAVENISGGKIDYIVLTECGTIYNMDYRPAIEAHRKSGADVTAIYAKKQVDPHDRENTIVYDITGGGRIAEISKAPYSADVFNVSLGTFIMSKITFLQLMSAERICGMLRFNCEILASVLGRMKVMSYEFKGYSARISSLETFFKCNMEMLDPQKRNRLFGYEGRRIMTSKRDSLPTNYGETANIKNSIIADGCQIDGIVENCVIFRNVQIKKGAVVKNSILQENIIIDENSQLDWIAADRSVIVSKGRTLIGHSTYPVYIAQEKII